MADKTILIVDDEPDVSLYLKTLLNQHGYQTLTATSVKVALELIEKELPGLICLDIMMPKRSGIALYQHLKEKPRLKKIPVIIVSGVIQSGNFDIQTFLPGTKISPPDDSFEKPIHVEQFLSSVKRIINRTKSPRSKKVNLHG